MFLSVAKVSGPPRVYLGYIPKCSCDVKFPSVLHCLTRAFISVTYSLSLFILFTVHAHTHTHTQDMWIIRQCKQGSYGFNKSKFKDFLRTILNFLRTENYWGSRLCHINPCFPIIQSIRNSSRNSNMLYRNCTRKATPHNLEVQKQGST